MATIDSRQIVADEAAEEGDDLEEDEEEGEEEEEDGEEDDESDEADDIEPKLKYHRMGNRFGSIH